MCLSEEQMQGADLHYEPVHSLPGCIEQSRGYKAPPEACAAAVLAIIADGT